MELNDAIAQSTPGTVAKIGGGAAVFHGVLCIWLALQSWLAINLYWPWSIFPWLFAAHGVVMASLGSRVARARYGATVAALCLSIFGLVLAASWVVISFKGGYFSLMALENTSLALVSSVLCGLSLPANLKATDARRLLEKADMSLGL